MKSTYNFSMDREPTDEELEWMMQQVGDAVRKRAKEADKKFFKELN